MTIARKDILVPGEERAYHCTVRCVRRAYLCGVDAATGQDYAHRKEWVRERLQHLSHAFALEVLGYSIMGNHMHVVPRTQPEQAREWAEEEVARRWLLVYPSKRMRTERDATPFPEDIRAILRRPGRVAVLRQRLASLSWFMRSLDEHIARRANWEDGCKGRFWEGRFKCKALLDEAALLTCLTYVDLNPVRAGLARTPEESRFTSAYERIKGRQAEEAIRNCTAAGPASNSRSRQDAGTQSLNERGQKALQAARVALRSGEWLCPFGDQPGRCGVFRSLTLDEYLRLLDATGRIIRADKKGSIPKELAPLLERLAIDPGRWPAAVGGYDSLFRRVLGQAERILAAASAAGRRWFQGTAACRLVFDSVKK